MTTELEVEATVAFVDLAGFTALTDAHGDRAAVDLVARFESMVREGIAGAGRLVKTIGDAAMLSFEDPVRALDGLAGALGPMATAARFPLARTGLHHGPVIERGDDLFGATVNLAARVAGQAAGGQVLGTDVIAQVARARGVPVTDLGVFDMRNISAPVHLFELGIGAPSDAHTIDPVCRMRVEHSEAVGRLRWDEQDFWFCSLRCAAAFAEDPATYASAGRG